MAQQPQPWPSFIRRFKELEDQVKRLLNASPFTGTGWAVIDQGQVFQDGSITIPNNGLLLVDGGDVVLLNSALVEVLRFGVMPYGDKGVKIRRDDGSEGLSMSKVFGAGDPQQALLMRDRIGKIIAGDALLSATGFDAPHIPIPFEPVNLTSSTRAQATSSTTFAPLFEADTYRQNPAMRLKVKAFCSDGTTAGEVQIWDAINGVYLGGFLGSPAVQTVAIPAGTTAATTFSFASTVLPGQMSDDMRLEIHARRTAGTGTVSVAVQRAVGYFI